MTITGQGRMKGETAGSSFFTSPATATAISTKSDNWGGRDICYTIILSPFSHIMAFLCTWNSSIWGNIFIQKMHFLSVKAFVPANGVSGQKNNKNLQPLKKRVQRYLQPLAIVFLALELTRLTAELKPVEGWVEGCSEPESGQIGLSVLVWISCRGAHCGACVMSLVPHCLILHWRCPSSSTFAFLNMNRRCLGSCRRNH